ncbi:hypothetical protein GCK72_022158 [Caenorhabditis remanei]|nr:hypothetical protein GCK72_022158 [Caenorhabditis remanei]KAF1745711.1 hypothetical protein GCK72_022158 [Caenorhabditis remanei]
MDPCCTKLRQMFCGRRRVENIDETQDRVRQLTQILTLYNINLEFEENKSIQNASQIERCKTIINKCNVIKSMIEQGQTLTAEIVNSYYRAVKCTQEEYDAIRQRAGEVSVVVATPAVFHVERRVQENRAVDDQQPGPSNSQSTSQRTATVAKMPSRSSTTDFKPGDIML